MTELYYTIKVICLIIGLTATVAYALYELWKWLVK